MSNRRCACGWKTRFHLDVMADGVGNCKHCGLPMAFYHGQP